MAGEYEELNGVVLPISRKQLMDLALEVCRRIASQRSLSKLVEAVFTLKKGVDLEALLFQAILVVAAGLQRTPEQVASKLNFMIEQRRAHLRGKEG